VAWTCWAAARTVSARLRPSNSPENILVFMIVVSSLGFKDTNANAARNASTRLFVLGSTSQNFRCPIFHNQSGKEIIFYEFYGA
jgi:hypothetical protein